MKTAQEFRITNPVQPQLKTGGESICIAVVDDDLMYRQAIEVSLKKVPGSRVLGFESGEQCFKHYHRVRPDILVLDYSLCSGADNQAMDGIEILRKVRQINNKATVIFLTGMGNTDVAVRAIRAGATDFITKDKNGLPRLMNQVRKAAIKIQVTRQELRVTRWITTGVLCIAAIVIATVLADAGGFAEVWNWFWVGLSMVCGILVMRAWMKSTKNDFDSMQAQEYAAKGKWID